MLQDHNLHLMPEENKNKLIKHLLKYPFFKVSFQTTPPPFPHTGMVNFEADK